MKRARSILCMILAALLVLSLVGCKEKPVEEPTSEASSETKEESSVEESVPESSESSESEEPEEEPEPETEDTAYIYDDFVLNIPSAYVDLVEVVYGDPDPNTLFKVTEIASKEAAVADGNSEDDGSGYLFSIAAVSEEEAQGLVNEDVPGNRVFAVDQNGIYYVFRFPTDVRFYRSTPEEMDADQDLWTELIAWANSVPETFVADNAGLLTEAVLDPQPESKTADPEEVLAEDPFEGKWACGRASMEIAKLGEQYKAQVIWGSAADTATYWNYVLEYDEAEGCLNGTGEMVGRVFQEDGSIESEEHTTDQLVTIRLNDNGNIVWEDLIDNAGADMEFEYAAYQPEIPAVDVIADEYFRALNSDQTPASAALVVLRFADQNELWNAPGAEFRDQLLAAWESLSKDEQQAFDRVFMDAVSIADNAYADWSSVQTFIHEMGLEDEFLALRESPLAEKSYDRLKAYTLTMGNSNE